MSFGINELPEDIDLIESGLQVYHRYLPDVLDGTEIGQSDLIHCDKVLVNFLIIDLKQMFNGRTNQFEF